MRAFEVGARSVFPEFFKRGELSGFEARFEDVPSEAVEADEDDFVCH
jgi:hypothetical protein